MLPGRLPRFFRQHLDLADRLHKKEFASYLNLSAKTLNRLTQRENNLTRHPAGTPH
jgi:hypothetical protein